MQLKFLAFAGLASLAAAQSSTSLVQALNSTTELANLTQVISAYPQLVAQLGGMNNITLLAPNNAAITRFLNQTTQGGMTPDQGLVQAILTYHVLNGTYQNFTANATFVPTALQSGQYADVTGGQVVEVMNTTIYSGLRDNSSIVQQSVNFTGGVIHIIDQVLTLPQSISDTARAFGLSSFNGALNATSTTDTINGLSDVTVFVPNNAAFQSIGSALPNLTTEEITSILQYHVINGTVAYSTLLRNNETVPTLQGNNVTITIRNGSAVFVNNARVIIPNVLVSNGVIHVIDEILNPNNTAAANTTASAGTPAFSGASSATEAPYTSGQPTPTTTVNTASIQSSATAQSSSSSGGAWAPKPTGAIGAAALGGLALIMQL